MGSQRRMEGMSTSIGAEANLARNSLAPGTLYAHPAGSHNRTVSPVCLVPPAPASSHADLL